MTEAELIPIIEALIYVAEEPLTESALLDLLGKEHKEQVRTVLNSILEKYQAGEHGIEIKEIANGYKMATKPEFHEWVHKYVKQQTPPTKLSLAALETLAVIAYRQPVTVPEIQDVRGVNAVAVLKTLLDKKLITTAGRKSVIGRPILYKTTKEFLMQFGLKSLDELPSLEEFEELAQSAMGGLEAATEPLVKVEIPALPTALESCDESSPEEYAPSGALAEAVGQEGDVPAEAIADVAQSEQEELEADEKAARHLSAPGPTAGWEPTEELSPETILDVAGAGSDPEPHSD